MTVVGTVWTPRGPSPMSEQGRQDNGLTTAIAINPNNGNVIYQGTAGGGVWRTADGGATWTPIFDRQISLGIGEPAGVAIDPNDTNTIYVGTSSRVTPQIQAGLFKSTDGGASCIQLGSGFPAGNNGNASQFVSQSINVIIVDPADSQTVYLSSTRGVFRSLDGGQNWTVGANSFGDVRSLVLDKSSAASSRILYAGINGRGVFQSTDGGQNWTQILSAATAAVAAALGASPAGFGKVVVDIAPPTSPPNPAGVQVLYVSMQGTGGAPDPVGVFLSADQGANWTRQTATNMPTRTQGGYSFHMAVDPGSPGDGANDIIYFGAVGQARSADSGANFTGLTGLHADTHAWAFFPQPAPAPSTVYSGNDGGIFRSTDGGVTWVPLNGGGLQTGLFYNIDSRPDATSSVVVGALQDNEVETTSGGTGLGWVGTNGGDGWDVAYDGTIAGQLYASSGFWSPAPCTRVWRSTDDGVNWNEVTPWGTTTDAGCYLAPVSCDPSAAGIVYVGGSQNLWQSRDGGNNWRAIGAMPGAGNAEVARTNGNNVVVAVGNQVFVSTNALAATVGAPSGVTFTNITRNLPSRNVLRAVFDPTDPTVIYAVLGGFNGGFPGQNGHVFRTTIGGASWTDISPALDVPFGGLALDGSSTPTTIFAGNDLGVLRSVDGGASWSILDDIHFPRAPVTDLVLSRGAATVLRAATYGRGVFQFAVPTGPVIAVNLQNGLDFGTVCQGPAFRTLEVFNVGAADLIVNSVQRLMGSSGFTVLSTPGTPLVIAAGEQMNFTVKYVPTTKGTPETATIRISSNDPAAPVVDLLATGLEGTGSLETVIPDHGNIGSVCLGSFVEEELTLSNDGPCPLSIFSVSSSSPEFIAPDVVSYPLVIDAGGSIEMTIRFQPTSFGSRSATLTVTSDDPGGPRTLAVSGEALSPALALMIADTGSFGNVCVGSFVDEPLTLNNTGRCSLSVTNILSSSPEFLVPEVVSYPLSVGSADALEVPIRFQPASFGLKSATITVISDDPGGPRTMTASGNAPSGRLAVTGATNFGCVECGCRVQKTVSICNVGECDLQVTEVAFRHKRKHKQKCHDFKLIHNPFPATVHPGSCLGLVIQYKATCDPTRECELVITSDDPGSPTTSVDVTARSSCSDCCPCDACRGRRGRDAEKDCHECRERRKEKEREREEREERSHHERHEHREREEDEEESERREEKGEAEDREKDEAHGRKKGGLLQMLRSWFSGEGEREERRKAELSP